MSTKNEYRLFSNSLLITFSLLACFVILLIYLHKFFVYYASYIYDKNQLKLLTLLLKVPHFLLWIEFQIPAHRIAQPFSDQVSLDFHSNSLFACKLTLFLLDNLLT